MTNDTIALLRRHDPAAALRPLPESEARAMRDAILHAPVPVRRRIRRRPAVAAAVAAAALLVGAAAVYSSIPGDDDAATVRHEYAAVKRTIDLPRGVRWRPLDLPQNAVFGQGYALQFAIGQAQCAWYGHWIAAAGAGDDAGVGRSYADAPEIDGLVRLLPPEKVSKQLKVGEFTRARIVGTEGHDLVALPI